MQIQIINPPKQFIPVTVSVTLQTQDELDAFAALSNSGYIATCVSKVFPAVEFDWWAKLEEAGANLDRTETLSIRLREAQGTAL